MNLKALFGTPGKAAAVTACLLAVAALTGIGIAYVVRANSGPAGGIEAIGEENAQKFAFADAGVDPVEAQAVRAAYERFEGQFVYSVEFIAGNTQYAYKINADDGSVVKKESKAVAEPDGTLPASGGITLEAAQDAALADAGVSREEAAFTGAEEDDGGAVPVYRLKFCAGNVEYEYEINSRTGAVYSRKTITYVGQGQGTTAPPSVRPDPTAEPTPAPATGRPEPTPEPTEAPRPTSRPNGGFIGMSAAKSAALSDAGVSAGEARFTELRMDYEDGAEVYVLGFQTSSREYEYRINARTGAVLSRSRRDRDGAAGHAAQN